MLRVDWRADGLPDGPWGAVCARSGAPSPEPDVAWPRDRPLRHGRMRRPSVLEPPADFCELATTDDIPGDIPCDRRSVGRDPPRGLVFCRAGLARPHRQAAGEAAFRRAAPPRSRPCGPSLRLARPLPAPRHPALLRPVRRARDRVLLSWLALRSGWRLHRHPLARQRAVARPLEDSRPRLSGARGAREYLGLWRRRPGGRAGDPVSAGDGRASRLAHRDDALPGRDRSRGDGAHGPRARALRPSLVVVALP